MMKPHIFIAMHYLEIGGAESSLIGLLEALDPEKVDIDLFIYSHQGLFMSAIPDYVNLLPQDEGYSMLERPIAEVFKKGHFFIGIARLLAKWKITQFYKKNPSNKDHSAGFAYIGNEVGKVLPKLYKYGEYDLAISYNYPHNIVIDKVKAKKKIAWLHTDYRHISINEQMEYPFWNSYDHIVSISPDVWTGFLTVFPALKDKIIEIENILPKAYIEAKANESLELRAKSLGFGQDRVLTLCSVGRISNAKNYDNVPLMAAALKERFKASPLPSPKGEGEKVPTSDSSLKGREWGDFRWWIIGPGDHSEIDKLSEELGVKENVIFLGPSDNPYPFIKNCDIYVHPSRYEGKSVVVREAQILCKPVIITNYPTAKSQINDGVDGIICDMDNKKIAEAIYDLANNQQKQNEIIGYLKTHDNAGVYEVEKIYNLL